MLECSGGIMTDHLADVFLMGTSGNIDDPNRSMWREPIKEALKKINVTYFDPVIREWNEEAGRREAEALQHAKIVVMAITAHTAGIGSLAESGWAVLSALQRNQRVGMWIDPAFEGEKINQPTLMIRREDLLKALSGSSSTPKPVDTVVDASRRARKLVLSHARKVAAEFPSIKLFVANNLFELTDWTVKTALELTKLKQS